MRQIRPLAHTVLLLGSVLNLHAQRDWTLQANAPLYLQGSVRTFDGQVPRVPVEIQLDCGGVPRRIGLSAADGSFAIDLRARPGSPDGVNLFGCSLIADASGFESSAIPLGRIRLMDAKPVGVIILTPSGAAVGDVVSYTSLSAPKAARRAYEKALAETRKPKPRLSQARQQLAKALELHAEYAESWDLLGRVDGSLGDWSAARRDFERSIEADSRFIPPYPQLVRILAGEKEYQLAAALGKKALELNPPRDDVRFYVAASQLQLGHYEEAARLAQELIERGGNAEFPQVRDVLRAAKAAAP
ncbi:MAG: hypothetical protein O2795_12865 [Acidobacteria bacterium]|nr:hypothetical protein [Acidobacteriota bacterium]